MKTASALEFFSAPTESWFRSSFEAPTRAQEGAWNAIASGEDTLVVAPTGSGKTLAAFLWAIDRLAGQGPVDPKARLRVLYVSPLKALAVDIERNLRSPLFGIRAACERLGRDLPDIRVGVRTGDTPADERRRFATSPPDILITTPESLFLLLTSQAREALRNIGTVIVDEVHSVADSKRGAHLALSLERLDQLVEGHAQRIGLSATVRPVQEAARWLTGTQATAHIVDPGSDKVFDLDIVVPVEDMTSPGGIEEDAGTGPEAAESRSSVWPHVEARLLDLILAHNSTIVFVNSRRLSERLCARLNELADERGEQGPVVRAHHGSVSREQRLEIEEALKTGRLRAVVATSSLELGIDMAAVDLVVQVEAPDSVASGLQRVGRAGHQVGAISRGVFFPKHRGDLLECAVVAERIQSGAIESMHYLRNPLDVLAQHIVSMVAMDEWSVEDLEVLVRRAASFEDLPRSALEATLDMLAGRYPSDEFAEFRARINWDRVTGRLEGRRGAQRLAVTSGGTIPDRGLFGVFLATENGGRVGELDEEMVYESRVGEVFLLGATSWLIEEITHDRVLVSPAPGQTGKMPFWHGDAPGRPVELGRAHGAFVREIADMDPGARQDRLRSAGLDDLAIANLSAYLGEQKDAVGVLPDDRTIVIERFRDELGDWRVCVHSCFGAQVHAPWAQAIESRVRENLGVEVQCIYTDDGIVLRIPETGDAPPADSVVFEADELEELIVSAVGTSSLFAGRFRESAARALLLPRRRPGGRQPLWQQRQKSATLLQAASKYPSFPVVLETYRECLQDVFDVPALKELMSRIARREIRVVEVDTPSPSPFASSLTFGFIGAFMYEGDAPLAERRAQALSLDRGLLSELLGRDELRDLIDPAALADVELELQMLTDDRKFKDVDGLHDALRYLGDLSRDEIQARGADPSSAGALLEKLVADRRALPLRIASQERWVSIEDAGRYRDALGVALPVGVPAAFLEPVADPLGDLVARFARTHGPFVPTDVAHRLGLGVAVVEGVLRRLETEGRVLCGEFNPSGRPGASEWIDAGVLRRLRRRSLAAFRKEIEPVGADAFARFGSAWHGVGAPGSRGGPATLDSVFAVVEQLEGALLPASQLERLILTSRIPNYTPALLDQLCAAGEVSWAGAGAVGRDDGWIRLTLGPTPIVPAFAPLKDDAMLVDGVLKAFEARGALFFRQVADEIGVTDDNELVDALWDLVWAGRITNDTLAPLRAYGLGGRSPARATGRRRPGFPSRLGPPAGGGRWAAIGSPAPLDTRRAHEVVTSLLRRHGVVTRPAVAAEGTAGGFTGVYPVFKAMEEAGKCRRGYFVEGLGGAQFALPGAVDRMRSFSDDGRDVAVVFASADPANPYGAALPWPESHGDGGRPGRKAGAAVVLVGGELALYLEKGGRSMLTFTDNEVSLEAAARALAAAAGRGWVGSLHIQRLGGDSILGTPLAAHLEAAGGRLSSRGLRFKSEPGAARSAAAPRVPGRA